MTEGMTIEELDRWYRNFYERALVSRKKRLADARAAGNAQGVAVWQRAVNEARSKLGPKHLATLEVEGDGR